MNQFYVGSGNTNFKGFFGNPDTGYTLPADVNIKIGANIGGTITRGVLNVGVTSWSNGEGKLAASSGGAFEAYVTDCQVGCRTGAYNSLITGLLDLSQMDSVLLDAQAVKIGVGKDNSAARVDGRVFFPVGGVGIANTLDIGDNSGTTSRGLLDLPGASFTVNTALTMKENATVSVRVQGTSCGLQLASSATASVTGTAKIAISFEQPADDPEAGIYYGMKWDGNHLADLQTLFQDGRLIIDPAGVNGEGTVIYDADSDATYATVVTSQPLTAVAKDLTIEAADDTTQVVIAASDIEGGSFDPNGFNVVSYAISSADDLVAGDEFVTLANLGPHTVTLTVTNDNVPPDTASANCTVELVYIAGPVATDVVWSGGASLNQMERREWYWGTNWQGGNPPDIFTTAMATFSNKGAGTNIVEEDRWVGTLRYDNPAGSDLVPLVEHTTDLSGARLTVTSLVKSAWYDAQGADYGRINGTLTNGTLQLGADGAPIDMLIAKGLYGAQSASTIKLGADTQFEAYIRYLKIGEGSAAGGRGVGVLDLRDTTIVGGTLAARNIVIAKGGGHVGCAIMVGPASNLQAINVDNQLIICDGNWSSSAYIGDPDAGNKLPADVSITVGSPESPGSIVIGRADYSDGNGYLAASSGGSFSATLSELTVGVNTSPHGFGQLDATLNLAAMDSLALTAAAVKIGLGRPDDTVGAGRCTATVILPAGTATAGTLEMGAPLLTTISALLQLEGTDFAVETSVRLRKGATVKTLTGGISSGLDLADAATLTLEDDAKIDIVFDTPASSGLYWGLRWAGDHVAELEALQTTGGLVWDDTALPEPATIFANGGFTYVGASVAVAKVTAFTLADATSGSSLVTNAAAVNVSITAEPAEGETIDGWLITESSTEPADGWLPAAPAI